MVNFKNRTFSCTIGGPFFKSHPVEQKDFPEQHKCLVCDKTFKYPHQLETHIASKHEEKKPLKCSVCDHKCLLKQSLKRHFETVHEGKKPHKCHIGEYVQMFKSWDFENLFGFWS